MFRVFSVALVLGALGNVTAMAQTPAPAAPSAAPSAASPAPTAAPAATAPAVTPPAPAKAAPATGDMEGLAAYYSDRLNGHKTASGQKLDQNALTGAHPTLPFGTKVKVTNTKNNRSVVVRINDRGPKQEGRVIDVTRAAAGKLGIAKNGTVPVKLEVVAEAPAKKSN